MPNYEIYPADIMAVLDVLNHTGGPVTVDSTDFKVTLSGTDLRIQLTAGQRSNLATVLQRFEAS